ncbi:MAG: glycosyltransferase [Opitutales bacterium]
MFTRFPVATETFLQREVRALLGAGRPVELWSLWRGARSFGGHPIRHTPLWTLACLIFWIPYWVLRRPGQAGAVLGAVGHLRWRNATNYGENLLGLGLAFGWARRIEREASPETVLHAVWASLPAAFGWGVGRLTGLPFTFAGHAYDLFEDGGDGLLALKLRDACGVRTSTRRGATRLKELGAREDEVAVIGRGLAVLPPRVPRRPLAGPLRLLSVGRFVPKMGYDLLADVFDALEASGRSFEARVIGDGPARTAFAGRARLATWGPRVTLLGARPESDVWAALEWCDALLFTGKVAPNGDEAGFPNILGEAMALGRPVVATPVGAVGEVLEHRQRGFLAATPGDFVGELNRLVEEEKAGDAVVEAARQWVEAHFDAHRQMGLFWAWLGTVTADGEEGSAPTKRH